MGKWEWMSVRFFDTETLPQKAFVFFILISNNSRMKDHTQSQSGLCQTMKEICGWNGWVKMHERDGINWNVLNRDGIKWENGMG